MKMGLFAALVAAAVAAPPSGQRVITGRLLSVDDEVGEISVDAGKLGTLNFFYGDDVKVTQGAKKTKIDPAKLGAGQNVQLTLIEDSEGETEEPILVAIHIADAASGKPAAKAAAKAKGKAPGKPAPAAKPAPKKAAVVDDQDDEEPLMIGSHDDDMGNAGYAEDQDEVAAQAPEEPVEPGSGGDSED